MPLMELIPLIPLMELILLMPLIPLMQLKQLMQLKLNLFVLSLILIEGKISKLLLNLITWSMIMLLLPGNLMIRKSNI